ncbi:hypothetical protein IJ21_42890 [Paenibacillus sp. 32O-W]|nr:hypothetical protein IJ21_42890 [Paenibacillus sp. 32O-W]
MRHGSANTENLKAMRKRNKVPENRGTFSAKRLQGGGEIVENCTCPLEIRNQVEYYKNGY